MARPASRSANVRPVGAASLLGHALGGLLEHVTDPGAAAGPWRLGPLVILARDDSAARTAVETALAGRAAAGVVRRDGGELDREIAAAVAADRLASLCDELSAHRLVVVDRIDRIRHEDRQRCLIHLFDSTTAAGATWFVSLPLDPVTTLMPQLASRLGAGLVVPAPAPSGAAGSMAAGSMPSLGRIIRAAARHHDVTPEAVVGPSRGRTIAAARSLAMYLARRLTGHSLQSIGAACGGRDHTTVLHGVRTCGARLERDPALAADVDRIAANLCGLPRSADRCRRSVDSVSEATRPAIRRRRRRKPA